MLYKMSMFHRNIVRHTKNKNDPNTGMKSEQKLPVIQLRYLKTKTSKKPL